MGNQQIQYLIQTYDLTYSQARRLLMWEDGMSYAQIAKLEGTTKGAIQASVGLAMNKVKGVESGTEIIDG